MPIYQEVFFNMILVPALSQALSKCFDEVKNGTDIDDILLTYQWFASVLKQYKNLHGTELTEEIIKSLSPITLSQQILGKPFKQALEKLIENTKYKLLEDE